MTNNPSYDKYANFEGLSEAEEHDARVRHHNGLIAQGPRSRQSGGGVKQVSPRLTKYANSMTIDGVRVK